MYMRLVHARYKPDSLSKIKNVYDKSVIPCLQKTEGCLCVCAIVSDKDPEEGISLTLWQTPEHAQAYEKSGMYEKLLREVKPYLSDTTEWHVQLSKDLSLEFRPVEKELTIQTFAATAQMDRELPEEKSDLMYLRIASVLIQSNKIEQFKSIYENDILPALRRLDGCRFAFMTENSEEENAILCVSLWESKEHADAYEESGLFEELLDKTRHTFSEFYRWKMTLEKKLGAQVTTSADLKVGTYRIVTGKSFK